MKTKDIKINDSHTFPIIHYLKTPFSSECKNDDDDGSHNEKAAKGYKHLAQRDDVMSICIFFCVYIFYVLILTPMTASTATNGVTRKLLASFTRSGSDSMSPPSSTQNTGNTF